MNKRGGKRLSFFCYPEELASVLEPVLAKSEVQLCGAEKRNGRYFFRQRSVIDATKANPPHIYICTPSMLKAGGWGSFAKFVQVWVPIAAEGRLRMGELGMLVAESELSPEDQELQEEIYRDLRKALTKNFARGVLGVNSNTGGEHLYNDILFSERAARDNASGTVLTTLMGDGFVTFKAKSVDRIAPPHSRE